MIQRDHHPPTVILRRSRRIPARSARHVPWRCLQREISVPPMRGPQGAALNLGTQLKQANTDRPPTPTAGFSRLCRHSPVPLGPGGVRDPLITGNAKARAPAMHRPIGTPAPPLASLPTCSA